MNNQTIGVTRKLDELGRITLPIEVRRSLNLEERALLDICVKDGCIILIPEEKCIFCHTRDNLRILKGQAVCEGCITELKKEDL